MTYIRIFSDLHLEKDYEKQHQTRFIDDPYPEFWEPVPLETDSDTILILAGDLWNGLRSIPVIKEYHDRFKKVLIVLGNHDYWDGSIRYKTYSLKTLDIDYELELIDQEMNNVHLLHNSTIEIDNCLFVGGPLWTNMDNYSPVVEQYAPKYMKADFQLINDLTVNSWLGENKKTIEYISHIVSQNKHKKIIVVTHHAPSFASIGQQFIGNVGNPFFASDYSEFILNNEHVKYWFHGHIHSKSNYMIGETRVVCNPRGYHSEENEEFSNTSIYEL